MSKNATSLVKCIEEILKKFTDYNQTVDIVSGFESFFHDIYRDELIYFDRFPRNLSPRLTPDFTALFDNYGIIFEMTRGIAKKTDENQDRPLEDKITQLKRYDEFDYPFRADNQGTKISPKIRDTVLILDHQDSQETFIRINQKIKDTSNFNFKNNLIFLDYTFNSDTHLYTINKYHGENGCFRDDLFDEGKRLELLLGTKIGKSLKFHPRQFMEFKAKTILCNDPPSDIYMAVFLWDRIFKSYLKPDQYFELQSKGSNKIQELALNIDNVTNYINTEYIKYGNVHISSVRDAMMFLEKANLAEFKSHKDVIVYYHNLQKKSFSKSDQGDKTATSIDLRELGRSIAKQYCNNFNKKKKIKRREIDSSELIRTQSSLYEF